MLGQVDVFEGITKLLTLSGSMHKSQSGSCLGGEKQASGSGSVEMGHQSRVPLPWLGVAPTKHFL